ncbi:MAG: hypothetical protein PHQ64_03745 [Bacilli bacterium]|nr:hypothetical protein [Bacilli bacterium]
MTNYIVQHGFGKGQKIKDAINNHYVNGVIFSPRDESIDSIIDYVSKSDFLNKDNAFLDPQFYYSTYNSQFYGNLDKMLNFPKDIRRKDWRMRTDKIINYLEDYVTISKNVSNSLITPGFCIDNIGWEFDYSLDIYNHCRSKYPEFKKYYFSLVISSKLFNSKNDVDEILDDIKDSIDSKDGIYIIVAHDKSEHKNYDYMDVEALSNLLYLIYTLKQNSFSIIIGYSFLNSILFSMLEVDYVGSGWFNTLRKFSKNRFDDSEIWGSRKKHYTSVPLLSYLTGELVKQLKNKMDVRFILSNTIYDEPFMRDYDILSLVDYEQQYWASISNIINEINKQTSISDKINYVKNSLKNAIDYYEVILRHFESEKELHNLIKISAAHLQNWLFAIDLFEKKASII